MSPARLAGRQADGVACPRRISRFVEPALLLLLHRRSTHGYALMDGLQSLGLGSYPIDSSAIYRALRRLENSGMVQSDWETGIVAGRLRPVYTITASGEDGLARWVGDLKATDHVLHAFLDAYAADVAGAEFASTRHPIDGATTSSLTRVTPSKEGHGMRAVISSEGPGLDATVSPTFGRCPMYVFVDTETMTAESVSNPAQNTPGGAGIRAAQFVLSRGAQAILTGQVGPNAMAVLSEAAAGVYLAEQSTVREALAKFKSGSLSQSSGTAAHSQPQSGEGRKQTVADLAAEAAELRKKVATIMTRISELEKEI